MKSDVTYKSELIPSEARNLKRLLRGVYPERSEGLANEKEV